MSGLYRPAAAAWGRGTLREGARVDTFVFRGPDRKFLALTANARRVARAALDAKMSLNARTGAQHVRLACSRAESSGGARRWRRGARRARVADGANLALRARREIVRLGESASGARDGGRRSFGALAGRGEKGSSARASGGSGVEPHVDSQRDRSGTRAVLSSRAGTGAPPGCVAAVARGVTERNSGAGKDRHEMVQRHTTAWSIAVRTAPRASARRQHRQGRRRESRNSPRLD